MEIQKKKIFRDYETTFEIEDFWGKLLDIVIVIETNDIAEKRGVKFGFWDCY